MHNVLLRKIFQTLEDPQDDLRGCSLWQGATLCEELLHVPFIAILGDYVAVVGAEEDLVALQDVGVSNRFKDLYL